MMAMITAKNKNEFGKLLDNAQREPVTMRKKKKEDLYSSLYSWIRALLKKWKDTTGRLNSLRRSGSRVHRYRESEKFLTELRHAQIGTIGQALKFPQIYSHQTSPNRLKENDAGICHRFVLRYQIIRDIILTTGWFRRISNHLIEASQNALSILTDWKRNDSEVYKDLSAPLVPFTLTLLSTYTVYEYTLTGGRGKK